MDILIFKCIWGFLLCVAMTAQALFKGRIKCGGGFLATLLVVAPYLIVFGWFSVRGVIGTFSGALALQVMGFVLAMVGTIGYMLSISVLRKNWSVSAAIKEGHSIVKEGTYKLVRHPMYFFMILVVLGSGLLISNYMILLYAPIVGLLYYVRARKEEELLQESLPGYKQYMKETKMIIPMVF